MSLKKVPRGRRHELLVLYQSYYECELYRARVELTGKTYVQQENRFLKKITFEVNKHRVGEALEEELRNRADRER